METYVVKMEARPVPGYGRKKDQVRVVTAPTVSNVVTGSAIGFRPNETAVAEAVAKALNKGKVHFDTRTDDDFTPMITGKTAKSTLQRLGLME